MQYQTNATAKIRYGWGYQDGAAAASAGRPFRPAGILNNIHAKHFDRHYQQGYEAGYQQGGME